MANNDVQHLLDMLYEMIDGAKNAPLTSDKCILNRDEALEEVKQSRVRFRAASAEQMQKRREELAQSAEKQTQNG